MLQRIAAGVIVEQEGRLLLVRHLKPGAYDFWVAPGGGAQGDEDLRAAARREALEECGLEIEPLQLAYVEDLTTPTQRECKVWFIGQLIGGAIDVSSEEAKREHIVEAAWLSRGEIEARTVFPPMLHDAYWRDKHTGFAPAHYVGVRAMSFY